LTKGQFSATADLGSNLKAGVTNALPPVHTCAMAVTLGATFVGRSFSGDKRQLHAMLKAAIAHHGTVMLDVVSPCVTFNDHEGSTKSYKYMKDHDEPLQEINFIPVFEDIAVEYDPGTTMEVTMHDGSRLRLRKLEEDYDPTDKIRAITRLNEAKKDGDISKPAENLQPLYSELEQVASLSEERFIEFLKLADMHHVTVRALRVVRKFAAEQNKKQLEDRCDTALRAEKARIWKAVEWL